MRQTYALSMYSSLTSPCPRRLLCRRNRDGVARVPHRGETETSSAGRATGCYQVAAGRPGTVRRRVPFRPPAGCGRRSPGVLWSRSDRTMGYMAEPVTTAKTLVTDDGVPIDAVHLPQESDLAIVLA